MIKKIRKIFQIYMIRPMIYQSATKISIALVLALLWNRFLNREGIFELVRDGFLVVGIFFLLLAWIQYLRMDGVSVSRGPKAKKEKKEHVSRDIVDYADEKIVSFGELEDDERLVCRFLGDVLCGALFLIPAIVALFL